MAAATEEIFTSLSEHEKFLLLTRYEELNFVDDISDLKCEICLKLAIFHLQTECKHLVCKKCANQLGKYSLTKCPKCGKRMQISPTHKNNSEIENRISKLKAHCFYVINGCPEIQSLRQFTRHMFVCKFNESRGVQGTSRGTSTLHLTALKEMEAAMKNIPKTLSELQLTLQLQHNEIVAQVENLVRGLKVDVEDKLQANLNLFNENLRNVCQRFDIANNGNQFHEQTTTTLKRVLTIVLVGEWGSGKSTLLNSFANCLRYRSFEEAEASEDKVILIPAQFSQTDEDYNERKLRVGSEDSNERPEVENGPRTRACKSYLFSVKENLDVRFIDSRGLASGSEDEEDRSVNDIANRMGQYQHIHSIAIVLKPEVARHTSNLERMLTKIFRAVHTSAAPNFLFIFTHCTKPGNTFLAVKTSLSRITNRISIDRNNAFCFENEPFEHLMALRAEVAVDSDDLESSRANWSKNVLTFHRLLAYVSQLRPHPTSPTAFLQQQMTLADDVSLVLEGLERRLAKEQPEEETLQREKETLEMAQRKIRLYVEDNVVLKRRSEPEVRSETVAESDIKSLQKRLFMLEVYGDKFKALSEINRNADKCTESANDIFVSFENNTFDSTVQ